jgi:hypothetical protein
MAAMSRAVLLPAKAVCSWLVNRNVSATLSQSVSQGEGSFTERDAAGF